MYFLVKTIEKIIKHSLSSQIFQEHINSIITGIILPKQLQIQFFKFYSKDWLFFKISDKLQIDSSQFHDLMLTGALLEEILHEKWVIFSEQNIVLKNVF